ncbi:MAG: adenosylmethionine--8-amino-7-oxononanoate transaminase, partial [Pseudomonadota bacterium]
IPIRRGKGVWLEDFDGRQYLDAISSWWVNLFGHCHPYINQAIRNQLEELDHVILAGFSHEPVIRLAERLVEKTPSELTRCFFADNGSSAIEIALKMSFHAWKNQGQIKKTKFVALENSYHGETLAALAVGGVQLYRDTYQPLLIETLRVPSPDCFYANENQTWEQYSLQQFVHMEKLLAERHEEIAAVIVEPLVQCAGSMRMYHPIYLTRLRQACDEYNVYLILDEIAVGFGRTGTLFALEQADIYPDFLCLSKGITGGYLPLSVVMTTNAIYDIFYDDYSSLKAFLHSHSYTGNPLACTAANATLDLFEHENILEKNKELIAYLSKKLTIFKHHPFVADVRQTGMIAAIELMQDGKRQPFPWQQRIGLTVYEHALSRGVLLRPLGSVIYFMPPYVISKSEIDLMCEVALDGIAAATHYLR